MRDPVIVSPAVFDEMVALTTTEALERYERGQIIPDASLKQAVQAQWGVEIPAAGFAPHGGENRHARRAAVATWEGAKNDDGKVVFTRRQSFEQSAARKRGKLDPELRRLQKLDIADKKKGKR